MHQGFVHLFFGKLGHLRKDFKKHCFISYGGCTTMKAKVSKLGDGFKHFFIFIPIWGRFPCWLIFFRWVEATNQKSLPKRSRNPKSEASDMRPHRFHAFAFCRYLMYIYISATAFIYFDEKKMWRLAGFGQMMVSPAKRHQNEMGGLQKRDRFWCASCLWRKRDQNETTHDGKVPEPEKRDFSTRWRDPVNP